VILGALVEIRASLVYATLIVVMFAVPVFFLEGITGAFSKPLVASFILAFLASLVVALTVTASLSLFLLPKAPMERRESALAGWLRTRFDGMASRISQAPRPAFIAVGVLALVGLAIMPMLRPGSMLPDLQESDLLVRWEGSSSASHAAMSRITSLVGQELRSVPGVRDVSAQVGRAVMSDKRIDVNSGELRISIDPNADYDATVAAVSEVVASYPGMSREVLTYLQAQVREELSGTRADLVVRVYGEDLNVMREKANEIQVALGGIEGIVDPRAEYPGERPTVEIEVDLDRAQAYGLKPGDVRRAAAVILSGMEVGSLFEEQKVFDVVVYGAPDTRHSLTSIENLLIDTPAGGHVLLKDVAEIRKVPAVTVINRDAAARSIDVTARVSGRGIVAVAADVQQAIDGVDFPIEYRAELLGEYAEQLAAQRRILGLAMVASLVILLLLQAFTSSWQVAAAYFLTLPMALLGGLLVAIATGGSTLSLGAIAGLLGVFAIAVRNGTTLLGRYRALEREGEEFGPELVRRATRERSAPILMTAVITALLFLPIAFFGSVAGLELVNPMAMVILGGLVTSTLYTLVGVPALYLMFGAAREPELGLQSYAALAADDDPDLVLAT
jgi:Cu/Ag efflux pump CusA